MHQLFIVSSLQLLLPVIQHSFSRFSIAEKKSAKVKCSLFSQKSQKFHTAEITGYTVNNINVYSGERKGTINCSQ